MKRSLLLFVFSISFLITNAQWVNIPDSNFGKCLTANYPTCMQGNAQTGFQMDTSCSGISNAHKLDCTTRFIADLTGIQYFKLLDTLYCFENQLVSIPQLSPFLKFLDCSSNQLTVMPTLPPRLAYLKCSGNLLTTFSNLPITLKYLTCDQNKLINLSGLPDSLIYLDCLLNPISNISSLPRDLMMFYCSSDSLDSLPSLPTKLVKFYIQGDRMSSLPPLPSSLNELTCRLKNITVLPALPDSLITLWCEETQLSSLPNLPSTLKELYCVWSNITSLPPLPKNLLYLTCHFNQLNQLPILPKGLKGLDCSHNNIEHIPNLPDSLYDCDLGYNPNLRCLPRLNNIVHLKFPVTSIRCIPNYPTGNLTCTNCNRLCDVESGCDWYGDIIGSVHMDTSNTCAEDSISPGETLHGVKTIISSSSGDLQQMYLTRSSYFSYDLNSTTNYEVRVDTSIPIQVTCPVSGLQIISLNSSYYEKTHLKFGVKCKGFDFGVNSINYRFRPGFVSEGSISMSDVFMQIGCIGHTSAVVNTTIVGSAHYISPANGALTPTSVVGNTLTYSIADMSNIQPGKDFNIVVQTDSNAVIGSSVCITATIHMPTPDYNPANDSLTICFPVVNSFDPNEKTVYPIDITQNATWLNYTVQFQNTGTDTAYDIVVRDTLSSNLDLESFQYLASSHSPIVQVKGNVAFFTFANINLLDSFHNEPKSHGWLQYRIKTKPGLPLQTQINNTAYIYFDLNAPVVTNTTVNTVNVTGIKAINGFEPSLSLYPNPVNEILHIGTNVMHPQWLTFYDASGRKVSEQAYTNTIDVSPLESGVYLVELKSEEGTVRRRFVR